MARQFVVWNILKCEHGHGAWAVVDGILTVNTANGSKSAQIGGMPPDTLARLLMQELEHEQGVQYA